MVKSLITDIAHIISIVQFIFLLKLDYMRVLPLGLLPERNRYLKYLYSLSFDLYYNNSLFVVLI